MLLKNLEQHCGNCGIIELCNYYTPIDSNYDSLCYQHEIEELDDEKDEEKIEKWCENNLEPFEEWCKNNSEPFEEDC